MCNDSAAHPDDAVGKLAKLMIIDIAHDCLDNFSVLMLTKSKLGQIESFQSLLKITLIALRMSYLAIICPNSSNKLNKNEIRSSWSQFEHFSKNHSSS